MPNVQVFYMRLGRSKIREEITFDDSMTELEIDVIFGHWRDNVSSWFRWSKSKDEIVSDVIRQKELDWLIQEKKNGISDSISD